MDVELRKKFNEGSAMFPSDTGEIEHVIDLLITEAEWIREQNLPIEDAVLCRGFFPLFCWLIPKIEQYSYLPKSRGDLAFFQGGWPRTIASFYLLLISLCYGENWGVEETKVKIKNDVLEIKSFLSDLVVSKLEKQQKPLNENRLSGPKSKKEKKEELIKILKSEIDILFFEDSNNRTVAPGRKMPKNNDVVKYIISRWPKTQDLQEFSPWKEEHFLNELGPYITKARKNL